MKQAIFIILGIELLMMLGGILKLIIMGVKSDLAGQGMTIAYTVVATLIAAILMGSAYGLASHDKWLGFALALSIVASFFAMGVLVME